MKSVFLRTKTYKRSKINYSTKVPTSKPDSKKFDPWIVGSTILGSTIGCIEGLTDGGIFNTTHFDRYKKRYENMMNDEIKDKYDKEYPNGAPRLKMCIGGAIVGSMVGFAAPVAAYSVPSIIGYMMISSIFF